MPRSLTCTPRHTSNPSRSKGQRSSPCSLPGRAEGCYGQGKLRNLLKHPPREVLPRSPSKIIVRKKAEGKMSSKKYTM